MTIEEMQHDHKAANIFTEMQNVNLCGGLKLLKSKLNKCIMFQLNNFMTFVVNVTPFHFSSLWKERLM